VCFTIYQDLLEALDQFVEQEQKKGRTVFRSEVIRDALVEYLRKHGIDVEKRRVRPPRYPVLLWAALEKARGG